MRKKLGLLFGIILSSYAVADTTTSNMQATANLSPACVLSFTNLSFGNLVLTQSSNLASANGVFTMQCSKGVSTNTVLSSASAAAKGMLPQSKVLAGASNGNTDYLVYKVNKPSGFTNGLLGWSIGINGVTIVASGAVEVYNFTATVDTNQNVLPDNYSDTLTATMSF